jgi:hypothetical protein
LSETIYLEIVAQFFYLRSIVMYIGKNLFHPD